ncbi:MAG: tetratricopeptide repeat protein [Bacteroidetes bacterium]|nr:tetratricopeptide repeat protein [Bacteroidota bacterium]
MRLLYIFLLFISTSVLAQDTDFQLAQLYYSKGEFEKALPYVEKIYDREPSKVNFLKYYQCLVETKNLKDAEKLLKKQLSYNRFDSEYAIILGEFYENQNEIAKASKIYEGIIDDLPNNPNGIIQVYNAFRAKNKNDYALKTLDKGDKLLRGTYPLQIQYADYYGAIGQTEKMMDAYVDLLQGYPNYLSYVQNVLSRKIDFSDEASKEYDYLKNILLLKNQKNPDDQISTNMLVWLFVQRRNFNAALTQIIALDKRRNENGFRVFDLGQMCLENGEYATARTAFDYIRNLGPTTPLFYRAEIEYLHTRFLEITTERNFSQEDITNSISTYYSTINRLGWKQTTISMIQELAHIESFYANQPDSGIVHLKRAISIPGITDMQRAELKMDLADILVLNGDIWDASIYYLQVDKDFKYESIGEEAKYKNARIFYFDGEFEFAQSQLDVLKEATSKLIANDAMRLSLLITENYGLDSNYQAMLWYAMGDLYIEQQQYDMAFLYFDSIQTEFNTSPLGDEILLRKAEAMQKQGKWMEAISYLEELLKFYAFDILADDAVFQLGDIYENHLSNPEKASEFYKKILFDYKGSLHSNEARKRFRKLRGDKTSSDSEI